MSSARDEALGHLRRTVQPDRRSAWERVGQGLMLVPRVLLFIGLVMIVVWMASNVLDGHLHDNAAQVLAGAFLVWGTSFLALELALLVVRDLCDLPSMSPRATAPGILIRFLLAVPTLCAISAKDSVSFLLHGLLVGLVYAAFAWYLPAALRQARVAALGLRSLHVDGAPTTLGPLAARPGAAGRRVVVGRLSEDLATLQSDGLVAHLDEHASLIVIHRDRDAAVVAHVHVEGADYRSTGARLEGKGAPLWVLGGDDPTRTLTGFRRRLRLAAAVETIYVAGAAAGAAIAALLVFVPR